MRVKHEGESNFKHTAFWVQSITAIKFTSTVNLHERVPLVWSLSNGIGLAMPALLIHMSNPPYVATCFSKAAAISPVH